MYVPPAHTRQGVPALLDPDVAQKLSESEVILGVIGTGLAEACRQELNAGAAVRKHMFVMSYPSFAPQLQPYFGSDLVVIDPANTDRPELGIVEHSKRLTRIRALRMHCWLWVRSRSVCSSSPRLIEAEINARPPLHD